MDWNDIFISLITDRKHYVNNGDIDNKFLPLPCGVRQPPGLCYWTPRAYVQFVFYYYFFLIWKIYHFDIIIYMFVTASLHFIVSFLLKYIMVVHTFIDSRCLIIEIYGSRY